MGLTVTQLSFDFGGSNPSLPTENLRNLFSEVFHFTKVSFVKHPRFHLKKRKYFPKSPGDFL